MTSRGRDERVSRYILLEMATFDNEMVEDQESEWCPLQ